MDGNAQTQIPNSGKAAPVDQSISLPPSSPERQPTASGGVPNKKFNLMPVGLAIIVVLIILAGTYLYLSFGKKGVTTTGQKTSEVSIKLPKYFINCDDPRQVIEESDSLYVACLGGVIVLNKTTGAVSDQIGMPDGLGNATATSLIKKGDMLYIGTQDGITTFNLRSREFRKISVKEGLVNGANIELFEDGDSIWVATFDGVSLFNTVKGTLTNYTKELDPDSQKRNIANALVDDKYVYFLEIASAYSGGGVIRYDRDANTFKIFKPDAFGKSGPYSRVDFFSVGKFGSKVYVSEGNKIFAIDENGPDIWEKITAPFDSIKQETGQDEIVKILGARDNKGLIVSAGNKIYRYIPDTSKMEIINDSGSAYYDIVFRNSADKIWMKAPSGSGKWLLALNLSDGKLTDYSMNGRPVSMGAIIAVVDNKPILESMYGVYIYDSQKNIFTKLMEPSDETMGNMGQPSFQPIPGTSRIFIVRQMCGQGCGKPRAYIYDYLSRELTGVAIPDEVLDVVSTKTMGGSSYDALSLTWRDLGKGEIAFSNWSYGMTNPTKYLVINLNTRVWRIESSVPTGAENLMSVAGVFCNRVYSFEENGNKFTPDSCNGTAENDILSWSVENGKVKEINKNTNKVKLLEPPFLEENYSPFGTINTPRIGQIAFIENLLWIKSDRGLIAYNPENGTYKLYGPKDGLLTKDVSDVYIDKYLWIATNWGGLSTLQI